MTPAPDGPAAPSLLAVFAHPDDESLACGGLLARCAALGVHVAVLSLSAGDAGPDAGAPTDAPPVPARLAATRARELEAAAHALGVHDVAVLAHADGMLPWIDAALLEHDIRTAIARVGPEVVVTFGPDGLYWHPDHIAVHERTTAVVTALGAAAPALFYVTMPPGQMRRVVEHAGGASPVVPGLGDPDAFGAHALPPTLVIDAGPFAVHKLAALRAHRSQMAGSAFMQLADSDAPALLGTEHYRRAECGRPGPTFLDALGSAPPAPTPSPESPLAP